VDFAEGMSMTYEEAVNWLKAMRKFSSPANELVEQFDQVAMVLERYHEDAERLRWLCKDGAGRRWTFWLGRNNKEHGETIWPCFPGNDIREAIDVARKRATNE